MSSNKSLFITTKPTNELQHSAYYINVMGLLIEPVELNDAADTLVFQYIGNDLDELTELAEVLTLQQVATFNLFIMNREYSVVTLSDELKNLNNNNLIHI